MHIHKYKFYVTSYYNVINNTCGNLILKQVYDMAILHILLYRLIFFSFKNHAIL
jgi:hypothetical protein